MPTPLTCADCGHSTAYTGRKRDFAKSAGWTRSKSRFRCPTCRCPNPATEEKTITCRSCPATLTYVGTIDNACRAAGWSYSSAPACPSCRRPPTGGRPSIPAYDRIMARTVDTPDGCLIFTGYTDGQGYGQIGTGKSETRRCHIVVYEHHHGPVPDGLELDHVCRNTSCVRPTHIEAVTHAENMRRHHAASR